jgi:hypothetical protein
MFKNKKAQAGRIVGFVIFLILVLGVGIPVSQQVITEANLTGISATIVSFVPVFLAIGGLVAAAATAGVSN